MEAEELWKELHDLFDSDDGSLPEIWITNLSQVGVVAGFHYLQHACHSIADNTVFWSIEEQQDKPIDSVPNAAALVVAGHAEPFHFLCGGLTYGGEAIPNLGVCVFDDQIKLDYRMGEEWNGAKLEALFGILKELKRIDPGAKVTIEDYALAKVRKQFETTWERFLQTATDV